MKKIVILLFISLVISILFLTTCNYPIPDTAPKNIVFTPTSGKVGDIVTITGTCFMPPSEMQQVLVDGSPDCNKWSLVYFNVSYKYVTDWKISILGTIATEFVDLTVDKIVCKVPAGAKTGRIFVNGYFRGDPEFYHPSEKTFTVLDASGDPVY